MEEERDDLSIDDEILLDREHNPQYNENNPQSEQSGNFGAGAGTIETLDDDRTQPSGGASGGAIGFDVDDEEIGQSVSGVPSGDDVGNTGQHYTGGVNNLDLGGADNQGGGLTLDYGITGGGGTTTEEAGLGNSASGNRE